MATNEKEYNGFLFDQLTILERIQDALEDGEEEAKKRNRKDKKRGGAKALSTTSRHIQLKKHRAYANAVKLNS